MNSKDYVVISVTLGWKFWLLPFLILFLMLAGTNIQMARQQAAIKVWNSVVQDQIIELRYRLALCKGKFQRVDEKRLELLGLWERDDDVLPRDKIFNKQRGEEKIGDKR